MRGEKNPRGEKNLAWRKKVRGENECTHISQPFYSTAHFIMYTPYLVYVP